jgi:hypothetical protein
MNCSASCGVKGGVVAAAGRRTLLRVWTTSCIDVGPICGGLAFYVGKLVAKQLLDVLP